MQTHALHRAEGRAKGRAGNQNLFCGKANCRLPATAAIGNARSNSLSLTLDGALPTCRAAFDSERACGRCGDSAAAAPPPPPLPLPPVPGVAGLSGDFATPPPPLLALPVDAAGDVTPASTNSL